jgi:proliferating cell nuclear antigen
MLKLKLENSKILKDLIESLSGIIDETEIKVKDDAFIIRAMDPSRIALLEFKMEKEHFDEWENGDTHKLGLNLDDLNKILKRSRSGDSLEIHHEKGGHKVKIIMEKNGNTRKRTFTLALLDIDIEEIPMDNLLAIEYPSDFVIDPDFIVEAMKDAEIYSEIMNFKAKEGEGLVFESSGQIGELIYELMPDDLIESDLKGEALGSYSINFLKSILKLSGITEKLSIALKTDHPIKMVFWILEGGQLNYFLAPRVEESDFEDEEMDEF